jgi:hypothetical protein
MLDLCSAILIISGFDLLKHRTATHNLDASGFSDVLVSGSEE